MTNSTDTTLQLSRWKYRQAAGCVSDGWLRYEMMLGPRDSRPGWIRHTVSQSCGSTHVFDSSPVVRRNTLIASRTEQLAAPHYTYISVFFYDWPMKRILHQRPGVPRGRQWLAQAVRSFSLSSLVRSVYRTTSRPRVSTPNCLLPWSVCCSTPRTRCVLAFFYTSNT